MSQPQSVEVINFGDELLVGIRENAHLVYDNDLKTELHSLMCLPLILNNEIIGVIGVANNHNKQGFKPCVIE